MSMITLTRKELYIKLAVVLIIGIILGGLAHDRLEGLELRRQAARADKDRAVALAEMEALKKHPPVQAGIEARGRQEIGYIEKAVDPATGKPETTNMEINNKAPKVTVRVDGQAVAFDLRRGETRKFESGKLVVDQEYVIDIKFNLSEAAEALAKERGYYRDQFWKNEIAKLEAELARWKRPNSVGMWKSAQGEALSLGHRLNPEIELKVKGDITGPAADRRLEIGAEYRF